MEAEKAKAEIMIAQIQDYWRQQGKNVRVHIEPYTKGKDTFYCIRSDMCSGLPTNSGAVHKPDNSDQKDSERLINIKTRIMAIIDDHGDWIDMKELSVKVKIPSYRIMYYLDKFLKQGLVEFTKQGKTVKWRSKRKKETEENQEKQKMH